MFSSDHEASNNPTSVWLVHLVKHWKITIWNM